MQALQLRVARKTLVAGGVAAFELRSPDGVELPAFTAGAHVDVFLRDGLVRVTPDGHSAPIDAALPDRWLLHVGLDRVSGQLWVGTQDGAARLGRDDHEILRLGAELPNPCVHVVAAVPEGTWLGTEDGTLFLPRR